MKITLKDAFFDDLNRINDLLRLSKAHWGYDAENFYLKMGCEKIGARQSPMMPDRYPPILKYKMKSD